VTPKGWLLKSGYTLRGNSVLFVTPSAEPQGPVLSCKALHGLSFGQRKATGPITVPSSFAPWTFPALAPMARDARAVSVAVKCILEITGKIRVGLGLKQKIHRVRERGSCQIMV
jgi:hypothetical protein